MPRSRLAAVLLVAVVLAGCAGPGTVSPDGPAADARPDAVDATALASPTADPEPAWYEELTWGFHELDATLVLLAAFEDGRLAGVTRSEAGRQVVAVAVDGTTTPIGAPFGDVVHILVGDRDGSLLALVGPAGTCNQADCSRRALTLHRSRELGPFEPVGTVEVPAGRDLTLAPFDGGYAVVAGARGPDPTDWVVEVHTSRDGTSWELLHTLSDPQWPVVPRRDPFAPIAAQAAAGLLVAADAMPCQQGIAHPGNDIGYALGGVPYRSTRLFGVSSPASGTEVDVTHLIPVPADLCEQSEPAGGPYDLALETAGPLRISSPDGRTFAVGPDWQLVPAASSRLEDPDLATGSELLQLVVTADDGGFEVSVHGEPAAGGDVVVARSHVPVELDPDVEWNRTGEVVSGRVLAVLFQGYSGGGTGSFAGTGLLVGHPSG